MNRYLFELLEFVDNFCNEYTNRKNYLDHGYAVIDESYGIHKRLDLIESHLLYLYDVVLTILEN